MRYFIVFLAVLGCVYADTPANCTYEDVQGMWIFDMGSREHGSSLKCDSPASFEKVSSLRVNLLFPNLAIDEFGNKGFWTLIYNQGFEVVIHGRKFFAFSDFQKEGKNVTSICDRTKPGLSHNVLERDWACFQGHKLEPPL
ncbi:hypothetical protein FSP39_022041 [Pinctada imbricata]|uniref:Cathepsin C exclusion domain-containing protein n=1 Tax=Pinctada imbricata TaxID=66713 RepID=A0AA88YF59_PINIB|nr:hypothetical protein FSP39_022041 [Pinctada imbricata]